MRRGARSRPVARAVQALTRHWRPVLLGLWLVAVYAVTLNPVPSTTPPGPEPFDPCLVCGSRGTADAILNVVMFVPLGLVVARRLGLAGAVGAGLLLSTGIETAQLAIPSRYSTLADIVWNTTGAASGAALHGPLARIARGVRPPAPVGLALAALVGGGTFVGGWLLEPSPTDDAYWGQHTPAFHGLRYPGDVLEAHFNGHPFPSARLPDSWARPAMLRGDWTLAGSVVKGAAPESFTSILSIYDGHQREVLYFGAHREHLFLRERLRAQDFRLDQPELTLFDALAHVAEGDTMRLAVRREGATRCIVAGNREWCGLGFTPARLWGLLGWSSQGSPWFRGQTDVLWLLTLFLPIGFFARSPRHAIVHAALAVALMGLAVGATRLVLGPWAHLLAAAAGVAVGLLGARALRFVTRLAD